MHRQGIKKQFPDSMKDTINMKCGPDEWDSYNDDCISLTFTKDHMKSMVDITILEYN